jgi:hypothetical protein
MSHQINRQRWAELNILEQMGNIGSEVGRSIRAKQAGEQEAFNGALERALDLFDATTEELVANKSPRAREVLRARDQYLELFYGGKDSFKDAPKLENYFMEYAIAARR